MNQQLIDKIKDLKKEKKAIILAHSYQNIEVDEVADYVGDSLYLSRMAAQTDAKIIIFAGVYFMAETAKILSPQKKVLLPRPESGCLMADMINLKQLRDFKSKYPNIPVVCYINSTAEVKAESDICCTSANAVEVVKSLEAKEVLFVPDKHLGSYVASKLPTTKIITYSGYCPIHHNISTTDIIQKKEKHPDAKVLVHPECPDNVVKLADYVGSTTGIIKVCKESTHKSFIIVTEKGVVDRLKRDLPEKEFILINDNAICKDMKRIYLEDIYESLLKEQYEIVVDEKIAQKALNTIEQMLKIQ